jgi:hypothetical protein
VILDWCGNTLLAKYLRRVSCDLLVEIALLRQNLCGIAAGFFLAVCPEVQPEDVLLLVVQFQGHVGGQGSLADPEHAINDYGVVAGSRQLGHHLHGNHKLCCLADPEHAINDYGVVAGSLQLGHHLHGDHKLCCLGARLIVAIS